MPENSHFHSTSNGCEIEKKMQYPYQVFPGRVIKGKYCRTHKINICRCGWEWQWHNGDDLTKFRKDV